MFSKKHKIIFLFLLFSITGKNCFCDDTSPLDSLEEKLDSLVTVRDSLDKELKTEHKEERKEKVQKAFIFFSYFNYSDRGKGVNFRGVEAYEPYEGKVIRSIDIKILEPFGCGQDSCLTLSKAKKFGNGIHFSSREWHARQDILFKVGEKVNPGLFADTEKLLWERAKYKNVQIVIYNEDEATGEVDVAVFLQDRLSWAMSIGYFGSRFALAVKTNNFFGLPHSLALSTGVNFNKNNLWSVGSEYKYNNILGSQINFTTSFLYEKLNTIAKVSLNRNFFSLKSIWAFNASYEYNNITLSLNGNLRDPGSYVKARSNLYSLWLATSVQANKLMPCKDDKLKLIFATKLNHLDYKDRPFMTDMNFVEQFIEVTNYRFGMGVARWDYYLEKNASYIEIPEYFPKGISVSLWAGPQRDEISGKRNYLSLTVNDGMYWKKLGYLYGQFFYEGYIRDKKGEQMLTSGELDYITNPFPIRKHAYFRQFVRGKVNYGFAYPEERYFNLNDINGIRGFYSPNLKGSKSMVMSFESDFFFDKKVLLSKLMLYTFCDMGWISANGEKVVGESTYQYGLGFGFRLRSVDLGLGFLDFQFAFYPRGKDFDSDFFQFRLYDINPYALTTNNLFYEEPKVTTVLN